MSLAEDKLHTLEKVVSAEFRTSVGCRKILVLDSDLRHRIKLNDTPRLVMGVVHSTIN